MLGSVQKALAISAVCFGMTLGLAQASESRQSNFLIPCDGTNKSVVFTFTGLGTGTRLVQSAEVSLFENPSAVQYLLVGATSPAGLTDMFATLGRGEVSRSNQFTGFYQLTTNGGSLVFSVSGSCIGAAQIQGTVVIGFF